MRIVLDANILIADYWLQGTAARVLLSGARRLAATTIVVPKVVLDEVTGKFARDVDELQGKHDGILKSWRRMCGPVDMPISSFPDRAALVRSFREKLLQRLKDAVVEIAPYPSISHEEIARRAIQVRRPFSDGGRGYRDALIWETVLELCREDRRPPVYLVTRNHNDFGGGPLPHADLIADLKRLGLPADLVRIAPSLEQLNSDIVLPHLAPLDDMFHRMCDPETEWFSLEGWATRNLVALLNTNDHPLDLVGLQQGHGSAYVTKLKKIERTDPDDVRRLSAQELLLSASIMFEVEVSVSADHDDYWRYTDVRDFWGTSPGDEATVLVDIKGSVDVSLIITEPDFRLQSVDIDALHCDWGSIEINPHPVRDGGE